MKPPFLLALGLLASASAMGEENAEIAPTGRNHEWARDEYAPLADLESERLQALGALESAWLERFGSLPSESPKKQVVSARVNPITRVFPSSKEATDIPRLGANADRPDLSQVKTALLLVASSLDAQSKSAMARPSLTMWFAQQAELSSAVTLLRMKGETTLSFPETAASWRAVQERGVLPALALRASVVTPNSGVALGGEVGARTTKTLGTTRLHGSASYFGQQEMNDRYAFGLSADGELRKGVLLRGNAFFERHIGNPTGALTTEGGLSVHLARWLQFDGVLRVQRFEDQFVPHVLLGLSAH